MTELVWVGVAFSFGLIVRTVGLPPLIGYLGAGFAIHQFFNISDASLSILNYLAHTGVLLLLFTVGLKLNIKKIIKPEVVGTGILHFVFSVAIYAPIIYYVMDLTWYIAFMLSVALSFSSTVLAAKTLETKNELKSFHGTIAIGILIVQDLIAMIVMSVASGEVPSIYALGLFALPFLRPVLYKVMDASGHDELLVLCGLLLALVVGGAGFHALGLSGELGALVMGALLAGHHKASELSEKLWGLKELFLIGFFLAIGMKGLPDADAWLFAIVVVSLLPLQAVAFYGLLVGFKLKSRSSFLTSATLTNFSEFGLIVSVAVIPEYTIPLALAVALSFLVSAPLNRFAHPLFDRLESKIGNLERDTRHPDEEPTDLKDADILIMGMGRIGKSAYTALQGKKGKVIGLDSDQVRVQRRIEQGFNVEYADAEHGNFWGTLDISKLKYCILAMSGAEASIIATKNLRANGFSGLIVSHAVHSDQAKRIESAGADKTYLTSAEAGSGLAHYVIDS
jgi:predicted Kef-type K+ transport protein